MFFSPGCFSNSEFLFLINLCKSCLVLCLHCLRILGLMSLIIWSSVFLTPFSEERKFSIMFSKLLICWSSGGVWMFSITPVSVQQSLSSIKSFWATWEWLFLCFWYDNRIIYIWICTDSESNFTVKYDRFFNICYYCFINRFHSFHNHNLNLSSRNASDYPDFVENFYY